jgi:hypothetical protein
MLKQSILIIYLSTTILADNNPFIQKLPFKEAIIEYRLSGNNKGIKTLYIKDYGANRVIYQNIESQFISKNKGSQYTIISNKWIYTISENSNLAYRVPNMHHLLYNLYKELTPEQKNQVTQNIQTLGFIPTDNINFKVIKNFTNINNIPCNMVNNGTQKRCYGYGGSLILSSTLKIVGYSRHEVISNIFKTKVDQNIFNISNLIINDDLLKGKKLSQQANLIISFLKKPLDKKEIFIQKSNHKEDYNHIIQEGIRELNDI